MRLWPIKVSTFMKSMWSDFTIGQCCTLEWPCVCVYVGETVML